MGVVFFAFFMLILLVIGVFFFFVRQSAENKRTKTVLKFIILFIIGLPTSWIIFMILIALWDISGISKYFLFAYYSIINTAGIIVNAIYKIYLYTAKKTGNHHINKFLNLSSVLCILSDPFPLILFFLGP